MDVTILVCVHLGLALTALCGWGAWKLIGLMPERTWPEQAMLGLALLLAAVGFLGFGACTGCGGLALIGLIR